MSTNIVADNRNYRLSVDTEKNRAYLKIKGFWRNKESVPNYLTDWRQAARMLKRKFTLLTDASEMVTHPPEVRTLHEEAQSIIVRAGVFRIAEVVKNDIAEIQLDAMAKKTLLPKENFKTWEDAERWLEEH